MVVGSGIGAFPKAVKEMGFEVQATDISKFIIKKAKKLQKDIDFKVDDIERIAGKQNQYNLIFIIKNTPFLFQIFLLYAICILLKNKRL